MNTRLSRTILVKVTCNANFVPQIRDKIGTATRGRILRSRFVKKTMKLQIR